MSSHLCNLLCTFRSCCVESVLIAVGPCPGLHARQQCHNSFCVLSVLAGRTGGVVDLVSSSSDDDSGAVRETGAASALPAARLRSQPAAAAATQPAHHAAEPAALAKPAGSGDVDDGTVRPCFGTAEAAGILPLLDGNDQRVSLVRHHTPCMAARGTCRAHFVGHDARKDVRNP